MEKRRQRRPQSTKTQCRFLEEGRDAVGRSRLVEIKRV